MIVSIMTALLGTTALADTSSMSTTATGMGVLENSYVKAGVNGTSGTLGSGGNTSPGLLYDSTGSGTFNTSYDYLTPGSPFDGFAIKIDGTNSTNNNSGNGPWVDADGLTDGDGTLTWAGTNSAHSGWEIQNTYSLGATSEHIEIGTQITAGSDATALSFGRFIDPDARAADGDSSSTDNVLGYGVIPDSNVAFSEALSSRYALGLYSTDSNVDAGITGWTTDADSYTENAVDGDGSNTNTGDNTIGLSWNWSSVSTGDILTASYAYIFGPSAFDAADAAITAGAGGGVSIRSGLDGRRITKLPSFEDDFNENAKVAVDIVVNENGQVISATVNPRGTTTTNAGIRNIAIKKAKMLRLNAGTDPEQKGTIVFSFKIHE